jgi:hypothetical protein
MSKPKLVSRALVAFAFQQGFVLLHQLFGGVREYIEDTCGTSETFDLDAADFAPQPDGMYIGELRLIDDGPGDWPGSREVCLSLQEVRPITKDEWEAFRDGDWPWEHLNV